MRSVSVHSRSADTPTPSQWDAQSQSARDRPGSRDSALTRDPNRRNNSTAGLSTHTTNTSRETRDSRERMERYTAPSRISHTRNDSEMTGIQTHLSGGYAETTQSGPLRRHDFDVQAMEANLLSPRTSVSRNPVPSPVISVRSEFPTINRSRQQQTLTCLITVEVPESNWIPDPEDLRNAPPVPPLRVEEKFERPPSPAQSAPRFYPYEPPEVLESITENLHERVENWHGLDFSKWVVFPKSRGMTANML